ncbi:MAG: phosphoadenosine phosphosulfate reductase family protein, partial [Cellulosimicrobium funkei]
MTADLTGGTAAPAGTDPLAALRAAARARTEQRESAKAAHHAERARQAAQGREKRSTDELREIARRGAELLHGVGTPGVEGATRPEATADEVVAWAAREFGTSVAVACSMADAVLPHVVAAQIPWVDVLFLDTGYHFAETVGTRDAVEQQLDVTIVDVRPELTVAQQDAAHGKDLFGRDPALCCQLR